MVNLPYRTDLVKIVSQQGSYITYRFSGSVSGESLPDTPNGVLPKDYVLPEGKVFFTSGGAISLPLKSADGVALPTITQDTINIVYAGVRVGVSFREALRVLVIPFNGYITIAPTDINTNFIPHSEPFTIVFSPATSNTLVEPLVQGEYVDTINCFISQLSRSLDLMYTERYSVITNHTFSDARRDLYLVPSLDRLDPLPDDWEGSKIERLQTYDSLSSMILQVYPNVIPDSFVSFEPMQYSDSNGELRKVRLPIVV